MSGSHIPVQYTAGPKLYACLVVYNTQEDNDDVEAVFQKLLGVSTKGKLTFGPPGTAGESLAYNQGWCNGAASAKANSKIVHHPNVVDADTGEVLVRGTGGKNNKRAHR